MNSLTITEQFVKTLFLPETLKKVKEQFNTQTEIVPIDMFDMNFRLYRTTPNYINLELLATGSLGHYFKPIGFFDSNINIYILHEFESDLKNILCRDELPNHIVIKPISLKENAVIAAFSMEVIIEVLLTFKEISEKGFKPEFRFGSMRPPNIRYDKKLTVNGYNSELIMTLEAFPQFFLDDEYGLQGPIGAYRKSINGKLSINPIVEYKTLFDKFVSMSLLSAFKRI